MMKKKTNTDKNRNDREEAVDMVDVYTGDTDKVKKEELLNQTKQKLFQRI